MDWDAGPSSGVLEGALVDNPLNFPSALWSLKDLVWGMVKTDGFAAQY